MLATFRPVLAVGAVGVAIAVSKLRERRRWAVILDLGPFVMLVPGNGGGG